MRLAILLALTALAATAQAKPEPSPLKADWAGLLAARCDLVAHGVRTPFGASVLRNTPYALAGYTFKSPGLRALFAADGGWYQPTHRKAPTFDAATRACIKKIKAFEASLAAKPGAWKAFKARVFADRATYLDIRGHSQLMKGGPSTAAGTDTAMDVTCRACTELQLFQIQCGPNECLVIVPGTGDLP